VAAVLERPWRGGYTVTPLPVGGTLGALQVPSDAGSWTGPTLSLLYTDGIAGGLLMAAHRYRGTVLAGIGDEAYQGPGWVIARRGDAVVRIELPLGAGPVVPGIEVALLRRAVSSAVG
jgi:hypothetical protein